MTTLIYAPAVTVRIRTAADSKGGGKIIDVSEDVVSGSVTRIRNGVSSAEVTLLNQSRKYDGMFSPMDTVVVYLRRLKPVLKFSGYLDDVPKWTAEPGNVSLRASCTLKRLQHFLWDPGSTAALVLLNQTLQGGGDKSHDGGAAERGLQLLHTVAGWPKESIHIGRVPDNWYDTVGKLADELIAESESANAANEMGSGSWVGGENSSSGGRTTVKGIGAGTGTLPATRGRISKFGGPNGGAYGKMALTGESGVNPKDQWYVAMRWPYTDDNAVKGAKAWWVNRKILVVSPKTGKGVVLRAADWGPAASTGRVIDVSPHAMKKLGVVTDDTVHIAFAPEGANLGPVSTSDAEMGGDLGNKNAGSGSGGGASGHSSGWGNPGDESNIVRATAAGRTFYVHRIAKRNFEGFVSELSSVLGYHPKSISGYNNRNIAGTSTKSNHAWGAAIDIDPSTNPYTKTPKPYTLPKPPAIVRLARKWGLGWGGEWKNSKDYMHFEVIGAPSSSTYSGVGASTTSGSAVAKWQVPVKAAHRISARFGETGSNWSNKHSGTDFAAPSGTSIFPVGTGDVHAKGSGDSSYGNWVAIDHGSKHYTFYAHMQAPSPLAVGNKVNTGTVIGKIGTTGNVTGPHVHVEYRRGANTYSAALASGGIERYILGGKNRDNPPAGTYDAGTSEYSPDIDTETGGGNYRDPGLTYEDVGRAMFNIHLYELTKLTEGGTMLGGYRSLMNDEPIFSMVSQMMGVAMRDFCSAPNGDFIAWFPDYFGHYNQAGKMVVSPLEIDGVSGPPVIGWSDRHLKTHQFVTGSTEFNTNDATEIHRMMTTAGVASIEFPELMMGLLNISRKEAEKMRDTYLNRYGPRVEFTPMNTISGARQEFFFACHLFQRNWANQYQAQIGLTFMPELYPGMLLCIPEYGIQGYVEQTTDSWNLGNGGKFSTSVACSPWSSIGKNDKAASQGLPVGAPL